MRIAVFLVLLVVSFQTNCETNKLAAQDEVKKTSQITKNDAFNGWINLFHGDIEYGWRAATKANWSAENHEITVSEGEVGLLRTTTQFDDFTLRLQFKATPETNSGVFIRTSPQPKNPAKDCYEINIAPESNPFPTGSIVGRHKGQVLKSFDYAQWHSMEIASINDRIEVSVDGQKISSYHDPKPLGKGFIGLQLNSGLIKFRNIQLKPENLASMFDGRSLAGWKSYPEFKSQFKVNEGVLNVKDGPGMLESRNRYRNFVMQLKVKTNAPNLNSGIFFRCIPGEKMNGYESQIHNGIVEGDRTKPKDCGTGGIFRRKNARMVVGDDQQWLIKTIIVDGPHVATWVNGQQVCDWTDKRKKDPNPRRGLRLDAGTIMIQGHDPTTDIDFKDLRIREICDRWKTE